MTKIAYGFSALQYVHDVVALECLNVGVVFVCPAQKITTLRLVSSLDRVKWVFPSVHGENLLEVLRNLAQDADRLQQVWRESERFDGAGVIEMIHSIYPPSDSCFRWGPIGSGIAINPEAVIDRLVDRYLVAPGAPKVAKMADSH